MKRKGTYLVVLLVMLASCKSTKKIAETGVLEDLSSKKIISNHYSNSFNQNTVESKLDVSYDDGKMSATVNVKLRMEKDKAIWLSATKLGFPLAKVLITPTKVSFYEKLKGTYFDGDFSLLNDFLGAELDFENVQNLLVGQAILNLKKDKYNSKIEENSYELAPSKVNELFNLLFFINPTNFKINRQEIKNDEKKQLLSVKYAGYAKIQGADFPKGIDIRAIEKDKVTTINIEYSGVEFNNKLTFPFEIPEGYKEIKLK